MHQFLNKRLQKGPLNKWPRAGPGELCPDRGGLVSSDFPVLSSSRPALLCTPPPATGSGLHLHTGGRLLGHHEATSPFDAVVLVLLGAPRKVASPLRLCGGGWQMRKVPINQLS